MATKQQVIAELKKKQPSASIEFLEGAFKGDIQAQIEAPSGCHWEGSVHCMPCAEWYGAKRSDYYDYVIEEIKQLPVAVKCCDNDCEGIREWGACEYWEE